MKPRRIFLSAATSEFGGLRGRLAALLQRSGFEVEHQDIFPQTAADTVRKLGDLISECSLVVHIVGHQQGSVANPAAVLDLLDEIPAADLLHKLPDVSAALGDLSGITYTQWEAFLALHYGIDVLLYAPSDAREPGTTTVSASFAQRQHLERLRIPRPHPEWCRDEADFIGKIMADVFRHFGLPLESIPVAVPNYLPQRNSHFRGRKDDLAKLHTALEQSGTVGITQQVALLAAGGVGKSSLALEFAWDCFAAEPVKFPGGVFWLDCRGREPESLAVGLVAFAPALGIESSPDGDVFPVAVQVRDRMGAGPPSLLILDNILDAVQWKDKAWADLLPAGKCRRLLTTRAEDLGDRRIPLYRLDCLSHADARALLHAYREDVSLDPCGDAIDAIIDWFGGLAIGLTIVGIYMGIHSTLRWDDYWQSLRDKKLDTVRGTEDLAEPADYGQRVEAVIDDLFHAQSPAEQRALYYATILPGDNVSDRWLIELLTDDLKAGKITGVVPPGYPSLPDAILQTLMRRGILSRVIDTPLRRTVAMHQVISERLRELLAADPKVSHEVVEHSDTFARRNFHRACQWTQAIVEAANFEEAEKLVNGMATAGFDPNAFHFNCLLNKGRNYAEARAVLDEMVKAGEKPNAVTFSTLLTKATDYAEARAVLDEMLKAGETPNVVTFSTLLTKATDYAEARAVFDEMVKAGETPNVVTFNSLLTKAGNYAEARAVLDEMVKAGEKPDVVTFNSLLTKATAYAEGRTVFDEMLKAGEKPDVFTFNSLLNKATGYAEGRTVFDEMVKAGEKPNVITFSTLLTKATDYAEARAVLDEMLKAGETPNVVTFSTLLTKATDYAEARAVFDEMVKAGEKPDVFTFNSLLNKAGNYAEARAVLDEMVKAGEKPNVITFSTLLTKAASYAEVHEIARMMRDAQIRPGVFAFTILISKTKTYPEALAVFQMMRDAKVEPNMVTFSTLFTKWRGMPAASDILTWFFAQPLHPVASLGTLVTTLERGRRTSEADAVRAEIARHQTGK